MNKDKPHLYDAEEWKIVRQMYFHPYDFNNEKEDPIERLERQESKSKYKQKSSR